MSTIVALYATAMTALRTRLRGEEGQTSLEWLGIGVVVIAILLAVAQNVDPLQQAVETAFTTLVQRVLGN